MERQPSTRSLAISASHPGRNVQPSTIDLFSTNRNVQQAAIDLRASWRFVYTAAADRGHQSASETPASAAAGDALPADGHRSQPGYLRTVLCPGGNRRAGASDSRTCGTRGAGTAGGDRSTPRRYHSKAVSGADTGTATICHCACKTGPVREVSFSKSEGLQIHAPPGESLCAGMVSAIVLPNCR